MSRRNMVDDASYYDEVAFSSVSFLIIQFIILMFRNRNQKREQRNASFSKQSLSDLGQSKFKSFPKDQTVLKSLNGNIYIEEFNFPLGDLLYPQDITLAWRYDIPVYLMSQKQLYLKLEEFQVVFTNYPVQQFPQRIVIACDDLNGLLDVTGTPTRRVMILQLSAISNRNQQGFLTRDLIYKSQTKSSFQLGLLRQLKFRIYVNEQTQPVTLPTLSKFNVSFKIIHAVM